MMQPVEGHAEWWKSRARAWAFFRSGLSKASWIPIASVVVVGSTVAIVWRELVTLDAPFDPLLAGLWVFMTLALSWRVQPKRDMVLAAVGFAGGFLIEWWGTSTHLWTYFTRETPPLWIVPAWPIAALATDRLVYVAQTFIGPRGGPLVDGGMLGSAGGVRGVDVCLHATSSPHHFLARGARDYAGGAGDHAQGASGPGGIRDGRGVWVAVGVLGDNAGVLDLLYAADASHGDGAGARICFGSVCEGGDGGDGGVGCAWWRGRCEGGMLYCSGIRGRGKPVDAERLLGQQVRHD